MTRPTRPATKPAEWNFRSFPTIYAFFGGMIVATLVVAVLNNWYLVWIFALFGFTFCTAHALSNWFRTRGLAKRTQRAAEEERERRALAARANAAQTNTESVAAMRRRSRTRRRG